MDVRFSEDAQGTPAVSAPHDLALLYGLGVLHGRHRPLQALILNAAGMGRLAEHLVPRAELVRLDAIARRLDLPARAAREAERLVRFTSDRLDAYLDGLHRGLDEAGRPFELRALLTSLPAPDRVSTIAGFILSAYLGLAEGQERMERAILEAVRAGADARVLEQMFEPHLRGWEPSLAPVAPAGLGFAAHGMTASTGSNAWAIDGTRTGSGAPMLAGDPHLMVNQLPSLFFEVRLRTPDNYWLGVTVPGLPGMAICRTRHIAWSGTFGVADNVDHVVEHAVEPGMVARRAEIRRRFLPSLHVEVIESDRGALEQAPLPNGPPVLSSRWSAADDAGEAIEAYLRLMFAKSADEAVRILQRAHTLSLHFVIADRETVRYRHNGRLPRRTGGWSGLYPVLAHDPRRRWDGFITGESLPASGPEEGMVFTANEARTLPDGTSISTFAQPPYRFERIRELLSARTDHDVASFQRMQLDLFSKQADLLAPLFLRVLAAGPMRSALERWDRRFTTDSRGAGGFRLLYRFALSALAPELGGSWFEEMVDDSELPVWWSAGIDRLLADPASWTGRRGARLAECLGRLAHARPPPLGEMQSVTHKNMVLGGLLPGLGFDRGPYPLPGSLGTLCQGTRMSISGSEVVVAPAYRFITDMADDAAYSTLPGGIDGSRFSATYARWISDHHAGRYHRLEPPEV